MSQPVFLDPEGKRGRRVGIWAASFGAIVAVATTAMVLSLFVVPILPRVKGLNDSIRRPKSLIPRLPDSNRRTIQFLANKTWHELAAEIALERKRQAQALASAKKPESGSPIVAAFYSPDEEFGIGSFRDHAAALTHVFPMWLALDRSDPSRLDLSTYDVLTPTEGQEPPGQLLLDIARANGVRIWPVLQNLYRGSPDRQIVKALLESTEKQGALSAAIRDWLVRNGYNGLNIDFENLDNADYDRLPEFLARLRPTLRSASLGLSIDLEASLNPERIRRLAENVDLVIVMAYDEHDQEGDAGPIASLDWTNKLLHKFSSAVPSNKLVVGIGSYAYDWKHGKPGADPLTFQGAIKTAEDCRDLESPSAVLGLDERSVNLYFSYRDDDDQLHDVWVLDGAAGFNQWKLAQAVGARGSALWLMGQEDPSIWRFLNKELITLPPPPESLETVAYGPDDLELQGDGDFLYVKGEPRDARREIETDPNTGLVSNERYRDYPSSYYVEKAGFSGPKVIALTFDDGPDPTYTPQVLDVLREFRVSATFFVIGRNAEQNPDLVRRIFDEGHEIGSHTFNHPNLDTVSDRRIELELNGTQRAIQGITGRTTVLFRPPYNADSEPRSVDDVRALLLASRLGYATVGESIDPQDWRLYQNSDNTGPRRTPQEVVDAILYQISQPHSGNAVLLHDGGGDRQTTVAALRVLIPLLEGKGYRFVPVSDLLKTTRDSVMPPLSAKDRTLVGLDQIGFTTVVTIEWFLRVSFLAAIALGLARVLLITPLALWQSRRRPTPANALLPVRPAPTVSIVVAAYNEEKVISRTLRSLLAQDFPIGEIVVVDDGSTDATFLEVATQFTDDGRVVLLRQENSGKAAALNRALSQSRGEIVVSVDADTQLRPDAVGLLVRHFSDARIGAVAGNVKVGNRINLITNWQSLEYITSQNLDRRAYSVLNAISVCPGAIGAWRKSALVEAGGYLGDTLAEDMDLTWRLRRAGWKTVTENGAVAYTEAPDSFRAFFRQRFRWAYGTLQCLWKHRGALCRHGWFGWLTLPTLWLFQIVFQVLAPLVDLLIVYSATLFFAAWFSQSRLTGDWRPVGDAQQTLITFAFLYGLFFAVELVSGLMAYLLDREKPWALGWLFLQRLVYRQIMYAVVIKSVLTAIRGLRQGWGKLDRKATVDIA